MKSKEIAKIAMDLVAKNNPYLKRPHSIAFNIGENPMYLYHNEFCPRAQLDSDYYETCIKDITAGYKERKAGYYDKWYRYARADEGAAYDAGVRLAAEESECSEEFHIIEIAK